MPFLDRTGPLGQGPMTGRGMGRCTGAAGRGYAPVTGRGWFGRGRGAGFGQGFGFRGSSPPWPYAGRGRGGLSRCAYPGAVAAPPYYGWDPYYAAGPYAPPATRGDELGALRDEGNALKAHLDAIESRIRSLEGEEE